MAGAEEAGAEVDVPVEEDAGLPALEGVAAGFLAAGFAVVVPAGEEPGAKPGLPVDPGVTLPFPLEPGVTLPLPVDPGVTAPLPLLPGVVVAGGVLLGAVAAGVVAPGLVDPGVMAPLPVDPGLKAPLPVDPGLTDPLPVEPGRGREGLVTSGERTVGLVVVGVEVVGVLVVGLSLAALIPVGFRTGAVPVAGAVVEGVVEVLFVLGGVGCDVAGVEFALEVEVDVVAVPFEFVLFPEVLVAGLVEPGLLSEGVAGPGLSIEALIPVGLRTEGSMFVAGCLTVELLVVVLVGVLFGLVVAEEGLTVPDVDWALIISWVPSRKKTANEKDKSVDVFISLRRA